MAATAERMKQLVASNLEVDGKPLGPDFDLGASLADAGVSSMDIVAFAKVVAQEFNVEITRENCPTLNSLQELVEAIDAREG